MKKNKYRNKLNKSLSIIGFGIVKPNSVIETEGVINNPNLELVNEVEKKEEGKKNKEI